MSGIFGAFNCTGGAVDTASLGAMQACFSKWFDDDHGRWSDGAVGLGHVSLRHSPQCHYDSQPAVEGPPGRRLVIAADVRLDNRAELHTALSVQAPLDAIADSRLLLAAYRKWREASPRFLLGDFSYAIWDEERRQLFCARDHVGVKPFYYAQHGGNFVFANDMEALTASGLVPDELSDEAIAVYLHSSRYIDRTRTFHTLASKLEPGATLLVSKDSVTHSTYWRAHDSPAIRYPDFDDYVGHLRSLLEDAVRVRLRTAGDVTSHLSGGLDSSAITVLASRMRSGTGGRPRVFNWALIPGSGAERDPMELGYADRVAAQEGIEVEEVGVTPQFVRATYLGADISRYQDNLYWEEASVRAESSRRGARTILSGWGGDELISYGGYSYYSSLIRSGKPLHALRSLYRNGRCLGRSRVQILKRFTRHGLYAFFNQSMDGLYRPGEDKDVLNLVNPAFAPAVCAAAPPRLRFQYGPHAEQKELYGHGYVQGRMECWGASAMRHAVEYRYPLLDKRLVEFALGIPDDLFEPRQGYSRYLFRSAVADLLPAEVTWAPKYASPRHFELRKRLWLEVCALLLEDDCGLWQGSDPYIDVESLRRAIAHLVQRDTTDFDGVENSGAIGPALAVLAMGRARSWRCAPPV